MGKSVGSGVGLMVPLLAAILGSCAAYSIKPTALEDAWKDNREGYIIYEPKPYLRITVTETDKGPVFATDLAYLPNLARPYRLNTWCFLAKADINFTFKDGWMLTGVQSKVDTTDVPKAVIDLVKGVTIATAGRKYSAHYYEVKVGADGGLMVAQEPAFTLSVPE